MVFVVLWQPLRFCTVSSMSLATIRKFGLMPSFSSYQCVLHVSVIIVCRVSGRGFPTRVRPVIRLNKAKCNLRQSELPYLGCVLAANGIKPHPAKIEAIQQFTPHTWRLYLLLSCVGWALGDPGVRLPPLPWLQH